MHENTMKMYIKQKQYIRIMHKNTMKMYLKQEQYIRMMHKNRGLFPLLSHISYIPIFHHFGELLKGAFSFISMYILLRIQIYVMHFIICVYNCFGIIKLFNG